MKILKFLISTVIAISASTSSLAGTSWSYMSCNGYDTAGRTVTLSAYAKSSVVTINGSTLRIAGKTKDGSGLVTEKFVTTTGILAYDSIVPTSTNTLDIYQFNAVTEAVLAKASLACSFYGYTGTKTAIETRNIFDSMTIR